MPPTTDAVLVEREAARIGADGRAASAWVRSAARPSAEARGEVRAGQLAELHAEQRAAFESRVRDRRREMSPGRSSLAVRRREGVAARREIGAGDRLGDRRRRARPAPAGSDPGGRVLTPFGAGGVRSVRLAPVIENTASTLPTRSMTTKPDGWPRACASATPWAMIRWTSATVSVLERRRLEHRLRRAGRRVLRRRLRRRCRRRPRRRRRPEGERQWRTDAVLRFT